MKNLKSRAQTKARSKFETWVYQYAGGPDLFAQSLGVHRSTVGHWFTRKSIPSLSLAQKILLHPKCGRRISLEDILEGTRCVGGKE